MTGPGTRTEGPNRDPVPPAPLAAIPSAGPFEPLLGRRMWLVTFTDLVSLLLAFFVMLYAMAGVPEATWRPTVDSLNRSFDPLPANEQVPTSDRTVPRRTPAVAVDLDYLAAVLAETLTEDPALAATTLDRVADAVILTLPVPDIDGSAPPSPEVVAKLGGHLRHLDNAVSVVAHVADRSDTPGQETWMRAMALAEAASEALRLGGYPHPVDVRARLARADDSSRVEVRLLDREAGR